jgi:ribosome-associated toxin RatA of RatAB toxin-antitoxin module
MKTVHKSVLIWYSPQEMYVLVTDVDQYSKFLPWCESARVVEERADGMIAEMGIAFGGVHQKFSTRNVHVADSRVDMELLNGLFHIWMGSGTLFHWETAHSALAKSN